MARVKAVAREYLSDRNHTRIRTRCEAGLGTDLQCKNHPDYRLHFNVGNVRGMTILYCNEHAVSYLDTPRSHDHVKCINKRYRGNRNWPSRYHAN